MKKCVLTLIGLMILGLSVNAAFAQVKATSPQTAEAIKLYKAKNYTQSFSLLTKITQDDPTNTLATYYYAMSAAQLGKRDDAISSYEKVMTLSPDGVLGAYAKRGKKCIEFPDRCGEPDKTASELNDTEEDKFIKGLFGSGFSEAARGVHEKQKIDNLKRDINRNEEIPAQRFKEYKDFSSYTPTNEEIVSALRTLKAAGLSDMFSVRNTDLSAISGLEYGANKTNSDMLYALFNNQRNASGLNPQLIQSLLTTQMTTNF